SGICFSRSAFVPERRQFERELLSLCISESQRLERSWPKGKSTVRDKSANGTTSVIDETKHLDGSVIATGIGSAKKTIVTTAPRTSTMIAYCDRLHSREGNYNREHPRSSPAAALSPSPLPPPAVHTSGASKLSPAPTPLPSKSPTSNVQNMTPDSESRGAVHYYPS
ncbi:hypothetical protein BGW80DRAFT_1286031, partial [Lactifluus volemus]